MNNPQIFVRGFERDNLQLNVIHSKHKKEKTLKIIQENSTPAIVYCATRKNCEELADYLQLHGLSVNYYHAGLSSIERKIIQDN